jgi:GNAT superfamily N-acetyltransferase
LAALGEAPQAFGSRLADWQGDGDREDRWRARLAIDGGVNLVASVNGQPVGMASGVPAEEQPDARELISMWVAPAARRLGVASRLIVAVEAWAHDDGADSLVLTVADENPAAEGFYRRVGYTDVAGSTRPMPDGIRTEHLMTKPLRAAGTSGQ